MRWRERVLQAASLPAAMIGWTGWLVASLLTYPWTGQLVSAVRHDQPPTQVVTPSAGFWLEIPRAIAIVYCAVMAAIAVHELGHFLMARACRLSVADVYIGSPPAQVTGKLGITQLHLGLTPRGRVQLAGQAPAGRGAVMLAAGPLANLLAALILLAVSMPAWLRYPTALVFAVTGVTNLLPHRTRTGRLSDGAQLLNAPARWRAERDMRLLLDSPDWQARPDAADRLLRAFWLEVPAAVQQGYILIGLLKQSGRTRDLLELHRRRLQLPSAPELSAVSSLHYLEWIVATIADLPLADANLAGERADWIIRHSPDGERAGAMHTLAVIRLRQGIAEPVESLCAVSLAGDLDPSTRATVLATVAMARTALGLPGQELLAEALSLDPNAELVAEAATRLATVPMAASSPEGSS